MIYMLNSLVNDDLRSMEFWENTGTSDAPDTPGILRSIITSHSIDFYAYFFINTADSPHRMKRTSPSDTPHNTGSLYSFD
jgi:hypothetical protein